MNNAINKVKEFHEAFGIFVAPRPSAHSVTDAEMILRQKLLQEEVDELAEATGNNDIVEIADALGDILYIVLGTACTYGLHNHLSAVFDEIHRSNMSKLDENGKPLFRKDGKVLKGPNFFRPNLKKILEG